MRDVYADVFTATDIYSILFIYLLTYNDIAVIDIITADYIYRTYT